MTTGTARVAGAPLISRRTSNPSILGNFRSRRINFGCCSGAAVGTDRSQTATGVNSDRPNLTGAPAALPSSQRSPAGWFNIGAFALEPLGTYGNGGRNTVIGPGIVDWDFSTLKNFNFTEKTYLQFRFEAFNFLNHPNWGDPDTTLMDNRLDASGKAIPGAGGFGTITSTRTAMRQLQFSLKLIF